MRVYVGTYTGGASKGIYLLEMEPATGRITADGLAGESVNPSFLALAPDGRHLYACNETGDFGAEKGGSVSAYTVDPGSGRLALVNQQPSRGTYPCHVSLDSRGRCVLVANYGSGSLAVLPVRPDGGLAEAVGFAQHQGTGPDRSRQEGPHAHSFYTDSADRFALAADLGTDQVYVYRIDPARASIVPNEPACAKVPPGAGPRHLAFHPNGRHVYVVNEMGNSVTALAYDAGRGALRTLQTVGTLPAGFSGQSTTAEIAVHPSGQWVYASNRGRDSIAVFAVDATDGTLHYRGEQATEGRTPRSFAIEPDGRFLLAANQDSDSVVVFGVDQGTGALRDTGHRVDVPKPVCVLFGRAVGSRP